MWLVYRSAEPDNCEILRQEDLNRSLSEIDDAITHSGGDYELVQQLPKRKDFPRCKPLTEEQWRAQFNYEGQLEDVESIKNLIFRGVSWLTTFTSFNSLSDNLRV